ncbi:hypothetical protein E2C01_032405 [Portunus trituberculatus]|uniref:Uncharacterized protein n=1 Tax=Portunus trituberculatus TaxID=210409 RepID=A0A5B7F0Z1_PORTR|nr:hypothetical protein [Portunus trituberculatus]
MDAISQQEVALTLIKFLGSSSWHPVSTFRRATNLHPPTATNLCGWYFMKVGHIECMAASLQLALYTWYHQHKKKDLGLGQKDWLCLFQEQVKDDKNSSSNAFTKKCEGIANGECVTRESQVKEKTKENVDKLKQLQQQPDTTSLHLSTKFIKEEQDEYWSHSINYCQKIEGAQYLSGEEPTSPLASQLNMTLNSPILLLSQGR